VSGCQLVHCDMTSFKLSNSMRYASDDPSFKLSPPEGNQRKTRLS